MSVIFHSKNPDALFVEGLTTLTESPVAETLLVQDSRNGPVIRVPGVTVTEHTNPRDRVLFNKVRDSNPFFSVFESLWMLSGRNDVEFPARFAKQIREYSDNGTTLNGAYGHRWRRHFEHDQLNIAVRELRRDPNSRRVNIQMWDGRHDMELLYGDGSKDLPCNLSMNLINTNGKLDLNVFNRSNDLIWGAWGANLVHFSFVLEFMAQLVGLEVGSYYQISSNTHIYTEFPITQKLLEPVDIDGNVKLRVRESTVAAAQRPDFILSPTILPEEIRDPYHTLWEFDRGLNSFMFEFGITNEHANLGAETNSPFLREVGEPMRRAWNLYKADKLEEAVALLEGHPNYDWLVNSRQWLERRIKSRAEKADASIDAAATSQ